MSNGAAGKTEATGATVDRDIIDWVLDNVSSVSLKVICSSFVTVSPEDRFCLRCRSFARSFYLDANVPTRILLAPIVLSIARLFHVRVPNVVSILQPLILRSP